MAASSSSPTMQTSLASWSGRQQQQQHWSPLGKLGQIPELFTMVLAQVDMQTLLTSCQCVNRYWRDFIRDSPALQRHLFFLPDNNNYDNHDDVRNSRSDGRREQRHRRKKRRMPIKTLGTVNPLLARAFPNWFNSGEEEGEESPIRRRSGTKRRSRRSSRVCFATAQNLTKQVFARRVRDFLGGPEISWRRMLVRRDPPVAKLGVWEIEFGRFSHYTGMSCNVYRCWPSSGQAGGAEGTTGEGGDNGDSGFLHMGQFYDMVAMASWGSTSMRAYWDPRESTKDATLTNWFAEMDGLQEQASKVASEADIVVFKIRSVGDHGCEAWWDVWQDYFLCDKAEEEQGASAGGSFELVYSWAGARGVKSAMDDLICGVGDPRRRDIV